MNRLKFSVSSRDVPPVEAGRRMGLTLTAFEEKLPALLARGFPPPDRDTGNFDLDAIDAWRRQRNSHLFAPADGARARDAKDVVKTRLANMSRG